MMTMFLIALCAGFALLLAVPHSKDRRQRLWQRGGSAALFSVGLFGSIFSLLVS